MIVVGLSGKARHGKGSVVQLSQIWLQTGDEETEVRQVSFASALKQTAMDIVLTLQGKPPAEWNAEEHTYEDVALYHLFDLGLPLEIGKQVVELAKGLTVEDLKAKTPQARKLLQFIGTEAFRKNVDDLYWVKRAAEKIRSLPPETKIVFIPDARFINEADFIREMGGEIWRIERYSVQGSYDHHGDVVTRRVPFDNGLTPEQKAHPSETQLDDYKFDIVIAASDMDQLFHGVGDHLVRLLLK